MVDAIRMGAAHNIGNPVSPNANFHAPNGMVITGHATNFDERNYYFTYLARPLQMKIGGTWYTINVEN